MHNQIKMMNSFANIVFGLLLIIAPCTVNAQRNSTHHPLLKAQGLMVDGKLSDWGTELKTTLAVQGIEYEMRNDDANLYIAYRVKDPVQQLKVFTQGVQWMFNLSGKRRDGPFIVFPVVDRISVRSLMSVDNDFTPDELRVALKDAVRGVRVQQMGNLLNGLISLNNEYGLLMAVEMDEEDALCMEVKIPLHLLAEKESLVGKKIAYQVSVGMNSTAPGRNAPQGARSFPQGRNNQSVWATFELAK